MARYAGFPLGNTSDTTSRSFTDQDTFTIRQWLGILGGNASTSISDITYGDITIEITFAPSDVLTLSQTTPALTSYSSVTNNETGISTGAGTAVASTPSQGTGYTLYLK